MMYDSDSGYVIAVLSKGKVLREQKGEVFLPFNSTYSIRIKNPHVTRVGVSVFVDGTEITDGKIIIDGLDSFDLKRMLIDGDLTRGPRLKFVSLDDSRVQDPTEAKNGLVEVKFYPEQVAWMDWNDYYPPFNPSCTGHPFGGDIRSQRIGSGPNFKGSLTKKRQNSGDLGVLYSSNVNNVSCNLSQAGATVGGADLNQSFTTTTFSCSNSPTAVLKLRLRGKVKPVLVEKTRNKKCPSCYKRIRLADKFCANCGRNLKNKTGKIAR